MRRKQERAQPEHASASARVPATAKGKATRERILAAAELEFGQRGYHRAAVWTIASRAGVGVGTFYLYFEGKDDALCTLVQALGCQLRDHLASPFFGEGDGAGGLGLRLQAYLEFLARHPGMDRMVSASELVDEGVFRGYYEMLSHSLQLDRHLGDALVRDPAGHPMQVGLRIDYYLRLVHQCSEVIQNRRSVEEAQGGESIAWNRASSA